MKLSCEFCRYWDKYHRECRRNPPDSMTGWPETALDDWCGEWVSNISGKPLAYEVMKDLLKEGNGKL